MELIIRMLKRILKMLGDVEDKIDGQGGGSKEIGINDIIKYITNGEYDNIDDIPTIDVSGQPGIDFDPGTVVDDSGNTFYQFQTDYLTDIYNKDVLDKIKNLNGYFKFTCETNYPLVMICHGFLSDTNTIKIDCILAIDENNKIDNINEMYININTGKTDIIINSPLMI